MNNDRKQQTHKKNFYNFVAGQDMGKLKVLILLCAIMLLFSHAAHAEHGIVHAQAGSPYMSSTGHTVPQSSCGSMYEVGKYPGRHKLYMHKKLVIPAVAMGAAPMWVQAPQMRVFTSYYFSSFYRSHINAILNSNDLLRGPPASIV